MIQSLKMRCANRPRARLPGEFGCAGSGSGQGMRGCSLSTSSNKEPECTAVSNVRAALTSQIDRQQKLATQPKQGRSSEGS